MESSLKIEERAADWLAKRDSGRWSAADEDALNAWLQAATAHWAAYIRLRAAWKQTERLKALDVGLAPGAVPPREERRHVPFFGTSVSVLEPAIKAARPPKRVARRALPWSVAAMFAVVTVSVLYQQGMFNRKTYSTPIGGIAALPLRDGTQVTLNTDSEIRFAVTDTERRIDLNQGEAFFDVAKDAQRPFVVYAGNKRVTAIGTQFSVRRYRNDVQVIVTEGQVRIEGEGDGVALRRDLLAGAMARTAGATVEVQQRLAEEADEYLTWRSGFVVFKDVELAVAVAEFNRYSVRHIVIEDPTIASILIGGNFRLANVDAFLRILQTDFPIQVEKSDERIVLSRK